MHKQKLLKSPETKWPLRDEVNYVASLLQVVQTHLVNVVFLISKPIQVLQPIT